MTMIAATYFDGRQSLLHHVTVQIDGGRLRVAGEGIDRDEGLDTVRISDRIGDSPRRLRFTDGAHCEVAGAAALTQLLGTARPDADSRVSRWEQSTRAVVLATSGLVIAAAIGYFLLLPVAATTIADRLPAAAVDRLSADALRGLDATLLRPTQLSEARQTELTTAFQRLRLPGFDAGQRRLHFRRSRNLGPNALALPSGDIVVTDDLVWFAQHDQEILGVLAHEAGHVAGRHGLRRIAQHSAVAIVFSWYVGDVSVLAALVPTVMLNAKYSRDVEREADDYAIRALADNEIPASRLAAILERMDRFMAERGVTAATLGYLSTHPATEERLRRLRSAQ
jgi:Zn-dependent protease with chaperone function